MNKNPKADDLGQYQYGYFRGILPEPLWAIFIKHRRTTLRYHFMINPHHPEQGLRNVHYHNRGHEVEYLARGDIYDWEILSRDNLVDAGINEMMEIKIEELFGDVIIPSGNRTQWCEPISTLAEMQLLELVEHCDLTKSIGIYQRGMG